MRRALALTVLMTLVLLGGCGDTGTTAVDPGEAGETVAEVPASGERELTQLTGYPHDAVPLYEVKVLETVYYSVRNDPQWVVVEGGLRNIYHSVYESAVPTEEVLAYYRGLCDSVDEDLSFGEQLYGRIGEYDIFLNTGFHNDRHTVYLTVDLPRDRVTESNPFFEDYPEGLVELPPSFTVFEEMYYETLVSDSGVMYARHFDVADLDDDGGADLSGDARLDHFVERYGSADGFEVDREYGTVRWRDGGYAVTVSFMADFDRGQLTIGRDFE